MEIKIIKKVKSEEYLECDICAIDCSKEEGYVYGTCLIHGFEDGRIPQLNKHYCSEHKQYHCSKHQKYCMKIYGNSVMDWKAYTKEAIDEWKKKKKEEDAEMCRLQTWSDQIEYMIIRCAECKSTICDCDIDLFDEVNGGISPRKINQLEELIKEQEAVDKIIREHFQRTGFSLDRHEVEARVRKEKKEAKIQNQ